MPAAQEGAVEDLDGMNQPLTTSFSLNTYSNEKILAGLSPVNQTEKSVMRVWVRVFIDCPLGKVIFWYLRTVSVSSPLGSCNGLSVSVKALHLPN